jgi:P-type conjugative transfer protein TrbJ
MPLAAQFFNFFGATEITQLLNYGQLTAQYAKQLEQLQTAVQTYDQIMIAGRLLTNMQWRDAVSDLNNIARIVQTEKGLAYSLANVDRVFSQKYPGYIPPKGQQAFYQQYLGWQQTTFQTAQGSLAGSNQSYRQMMTQQNYLAYLQDKNTNAEGQMQAIQTGNQVAIENIKALNDLRSIQLANMQSMQTYQGYQLQKEAQQHGQENDFFAPSKAVRDGVGW